MSLEDGDGFVPAHRLMKKLTSWSQAAAKPTPTALTVNAVMDSAFMKLARLESRSARLFLADSRSPPAGSEPVNRSSEDAGLGLNCNSGSQHRKSVGPRDDDDASCHDDLDDDDDGIGPDH